MNQNAILYVIAAALLVLLASPAEAVGGDMAWYNIHCNVNDASVYFDGEYKGQITGGILSVGVYTTATPYQRVSVQKSGYYTAQTTLPAVPAAGEDVDVYVTLNPIPSPTTSDTGNLYISTSPSGARIFLNNVYQGLSPITLSGLREGSYNIEAEAEGYETGETTATVYGGSTQYVQLNLITPGSISVTSNPSGAYVSVNAKIVGQTPYVITGLSSGGHEIEVSKNGYYNWKKSVNVVEGTQIALHAELKPISNVQGIYVDSNPAGAKIYLDGVYVGETMDQQSFPITNVVPGQHQIKLTLAGFPDYITYVTVVRDGAAITVSAEMGSTPAPTTGSIYITSTPSGAMVYLDDIYSGAITPYTITGVSPGEHSIMLRLSGYQDSFSKINVNAGETSTLSMGLAKPGGQPIQPTQSAPGILAVTALFSVFAAICLLRRK
ncbi:PEGA domain-containing protein [Methanoplanus sp. FWC-SCC4]|uniref:PEGA domain-containing protein n=1 Tax=Methanochimaera problematica TaxID=2609417 RepID=A0AA97FD86_9EURY|nr:PEGA domain-containing protein [Methanoplanus sp. FWC-SCC4]WOF17365.1 PEGA domain-containing protein [Methanoplanus sp. FWC-SCC4]